MVNVIFDLGGVLFARSPQKMTDDFVEFFSFIADKKMPLYWEEYDRGALTMEQTIDELVVVKGLSREVCRSYVLDAINMQEAIEPTAKLVEELKAKGYKLYVLSNMSKEFIEFLRKTPIYQCFDGEVVSCEEHTVKPEERIYKILLDRYDLDPSQSLFIDDRAANLETANRLGINTFLFKRRDQDACCDQIREILNINLNNTN